MNVRIRPTDNSVNTLPKLWVLLLFLLLFTASCGFGPLSSAPNEPYQPIRSPYPTFTPTAVGLAQANGQTTTSSASPSTSNELPTATPFPPTATPAAPVDPPTVAPTAIPAPPRLVVNAPLANVRTGPGTTYNVLTTVERGQEYDIVGKNAAGDWWRFCCVNGEPAWIISDLVDIDGAAELAPISEAVAQAAPTNTAAPPVAATQAPAAATIAPTDPPAAAEPSQPAAPTFAFELVAAEQFSEPKLVRVFLYVYDAENALEGYSVRVKKDGAEQSVSAVSFGGQPGQTWPITDVRQRFQNMKVEFPNVAAAGVWEVQLIDSGGNPVGPPAVFSLKANEPNQELYVRYKKL